MDRNRAIFHYLTECSYFKGGASSESGKDFELTSMSDLIRNYFVEQVGRSILSLLRIYLVTGQRRTQPLDDLRNFYFNNYFVLGVIRICFEIFSDLMFLFSSKSCPQNLVLFGSHQAKIIIVKRLIQERKNLTRVRVEPKLCYQIRSSKKRCPFPFGRPRCRWYSWISATLKSKCRAATLWFYRFFKNL